MKIAVSHPGKIGDILYALPTIRHISKITGEKVDFWTQKEISPITTLFEAQSCINKVYIDDKYVKQNENCGVQPPFLSIPPKYDRVYQLGLREYPRCRLVDYYPQLCGFFMADTSIHYDLPENSSPHIKILLSPGRNPLLKGIFSELLKYWAKEDIGQIGPKTELIGQERCFSGDLLETAILLSKCDLFIGTLSANLVLANGFPCKKIVICEPDRWNPSHDIQSTNHHYIKFPTSLDEILKFAPNI